MFVFSIIYLNTIHPILESNIGVLPAGIVTALFAFLVMFAFVYLSLYGFFGGFDDFGFKVFKTAGQMSGPSKILMLIIANLVQIGIKISPFHNKHAIPSKFAELEAFELMYQSEQAIRNETKIDVSG
jgi:hypothetical protein